MRGVVKTAAQRPPRTLATNAPSDVLQLRGRSLAAAGRASVSVDCSPVGLLQEHPPNLLREESADKNSYETIDVGNPKSDNNCWNWAPGTVGIKGGDGEVHAIRPTGERYTMAPTEIAKLAVAPLEEALAHANPAALERSRPERSKPGAIEPKSRSVVGASDASGLAVVMPATKAAAMLVGASHRGKVPVSSPKRGAVLESAHVASKGRGETAVVDARPPNTKSAVHETAQPIPWSTPAAVDSLVEAATRAGHSENGGSTGVAKPIAAVTRGGAIAPKHAAPSLAEAAERLAEIASSVAAVAADAALGAARGSECGGPPHFGRPSPAQAEAVPCVQAKAVSEPPVGMSRRVLSAPALGNAADAGDRNEKIPPLARAVPKRQLARLPSGGVVAKGSIESSKCAGLGRNGDAVAQPGSRKTGRPLPGRENLVVTVADKEEHSVESISSKKAPVEAGGLRAPIFSEDVSDPVTDSHNPAEGAASRSDRPPRPKVSVATSKVASRAHQAVSNTVAKHGAVAMSPKLSKPERRGETASNRDNSDASGNDLAVPEGGGCVASSSTNLGRVLVLPPAAAAWAEEGESSGRADSARTNSPHEVEQVLRSALYDPLEGEGCSRPVWRGTSIPQEVEEVLFSALCGPPETIRSICQTLGKADLALVSEAGVVGPERAADSTKASGSGIRNGSPPLSSGVAPSMEIASRIAKLDPMWHGALLELLVQAEKNPAPRVAPRLRGGVGVARSVRGSCDRRPSPPSAIYLGRERCGVPRPLRREL